MKDTCNPDEVYREVVKPTDGPVSRYFNRFISTRITCFLVNHGIDTSPNKLTLLIGLIGIFSGLVAIKHVLLGALLIQLTSILDGVDGEYARLTGKVSRYGAFLDSVMDRVVDVFILAGASTHLFQILHPFQAFILAVWVLSSSIIVSYMHCRGEASLGAKLQLINGKPYAGRDVRLLLVALALLAAYINPYLYAFTLSIIGVLSTIYVFDRMVKAYTLYGEKPWMQ